MATKFWPTAIAFPADLSGDAADQLDKHLSQYSQINRNEKEINTKCPNCQRPYRAFTKNGVDQEEYHKRLLTLLKNGCSHKNDLIVEP
jgi:hypothetical protein